MTTHTPLWKTLRTRRTFCTPTQPPPDARVRVLELEICILGVTADDPVWTDEQTYLAFAESVEALLSFVALDSTIWIDGEDGRRWRVERVAESPFGHDRRVLRQS